MSDYYTPIKGTQYNTIQYSTIHLFSANTIQYPPVLEARLRWRARSPPCWWSRPGSLHIGAWRCFARPRQDASTARLSSLSIFSTDRIGPACQHGSAAQCWSSAQQLAAPQRDWSARVRASMEAALVHLAALPVALAAAADLPSFLVAGCCCCFSLFLCSSSSCSSVTARRPLSLRRSSAPNRRPPRLSHASALARLQGSAR